jgi:MFS family permease
VPRLALVRRALSRADLSPLVWLSFVATFAFIGMESTFALFGERRFDYDTVQMGLLFVYIGVMAALSQGYLVGRVVERWGETRVMIGGLVGTSAGLLLVGLSHELWLLLVGLAALAIASGFVFATTTALISLAAGDRDQGAVLGLNAAVSGAGRIAGPIVATLLFQHAGIEVPLLAGAVLFGLCALGAIRVVGRPALAS